MSGSLKFLGELKKGLFLINFKLLRFEDSLKILRKCIVLADFYILVSFFLPFLKSYLFFYVLNHSWMLLISCRKPCTPHPSPHRKRWPPSGSSSKHAVCLLDKDLTTKFFGTGPTCLMKGSGAFSSFWVAWRAALCPSRRLWSMSD